MDFTSFAVFLISKRCRFAAVAAAVSNSCPIEANAANCGNRLRGRVPGARVEFKLNVIDENVIEFNDTKWGPWERLSTSTHHHPRRAAPDPSTIYVHIKSAKVRRIQLNVLIVGGNATKVRENNGQKIDNEMVEMVGEGGRNKFVSTKVSPRTLS